MNATASVNLEMFLAEAPWLRGLARTLASPAEADDLVQAAYERLVTDPPRHQDSPRGWLSTVLRNAHRMRSRGTIRRQAREAKDAGPAPLPSAETLAAHAEVMGVLARAVAELDEPFRRTVLLHYYEGCALADIARDEDCPAATVRTRLRTALQRLRADLDEAHGGKRSLWAAAVAPVAVATPAVASGTLVLGVVVGLALAPGLAAVALHTTGPNAEVGTAAASASRARPIADVTPEPQNTAPTSAVLPSVSSAALAAPLAKDEEAHPPAAAARAERLAKVKQARLERLRAEGLDTSTVEEASENEKFLSDIESMMMMGSGAELAESCKEEAAPAPGTTRVVEVDFLGEPDVGTVIENVTAQLAEGETSGAWTRCLVESMYLISLAPPQKPGAQSVALQFAVDAQGQLMTSMVEPTVESAESGPHRDLRRLRNED